MITVLLIKCETDTLLKRKGELEQTGYRVVAASSSREALNALDSESPDIAIVDTDLWRAEELSALQALKSANRNFPAIIYTDHSLFRDDFRYRMADAFLVRGSRQSSLEQCISRVLNHNTTVVEDVETVVSSVQECTPK